MRKFAHSQRNNIFPLCPSTVIDIDKFCFLKLSKSLEDTGYSIPFIFRVSSFCFKSVSILSQCLPLDLTLFKHSTEKEKKILSLFFILIIAFLSANHLGRGI